MPEDYKNKLMTVLCNDCLTRSNIPYHIYGGKCKACNSYNTTRCDAVLFDAPEEAPSATESKEEEQKER